MAEIKSLGGKNSTNGGSRGGNSGNTNAASTGANNNDGKGTPPWPMYVNPWQGHIAMYPGPAPVGQQRPQAFMAMPGTFMPPGFAPG